VICANKLSQTHRYGLGRYAFPMDLPRPADLLLRVAEASGDEEALEAVRAAVNEAEDEEILVPEEAQIVLRHWLRQQWARIVVDLLAPRAERLGPLGFLSDALFSAGREAEFPKHVDDLMIPGLATVCIESQTSPVALRGVMRTCCLDISRRRSCSVFRGACHDNVHTVHRASCTSRAGIEVSSMPTITCGCTFAQLQSSEFAKI